MSQDNDIRVKIISDSLASCLEDQINEFIEAQFPSVEILNIQYTSHYDGDDQVNEYSALLLYRIMN